MTEQPDDDKGEETQEQRALRAIYAIANGADSTDEAARLSNEFTDRHIARVFGWFTGHKRQ